MEMSAITVKSKRYNDIIVRGAKEDIEKLMRLELYVTAKGDIKQTYFDRELGQRVYADIKGAMRYPFTLEEVKHG